MFTATAAARGTAPDEITDIVIRDPFMKVKGGKLSNPIT